ncbi:hypothetical protein [Nodosilinea sp. P-1105]|uniref:hypothetical protein n=1 Tax=Nodosilinea sp. P-1105 TaxID=2546229 RepID=UPI00146C06E7|nr:hypothetical protein [Nodosilinea sp. P-1105]NMF82542.1 hypothetical protein [Nodosilinea sp. P-1105]
MTTETSSHQLTIIFNDGTVQTYALMATQGDGTQMVSRLKSIMDSTLLTLEVENRLMMFPIANIRSLELTPSLPKLPDTVIRHVQLVP